MMHPRLHEQLGPKKRWPVLVGVLVLLLVIWTCALAVAAGQVYARASTGKRALEAAERLVMEMKFEQAQAELSKAQEHFGRTRYGMRVLKSAGFVPWVRTQIYAADAGLRAGEQSAQVLTDVLEVGVELVRLSDLAQFEIGETLEGVGQAATFDDLPSEVKRQILLRLYASSDKLMLAQARLDIVAEELSRFSNQPLLPALASTFSRLEGTLGEMQRLLRLLNAGASLLPEFGGLQGARTHLLLFLNNNELRPGGGFIGTYGVLTMRDGDIHQLETHDVYNLDRKVASVDLQSAPAPLVRYNAAGAWYLRDANWSPDFSVSAEKAAELFEQESAASGLKTRLDGVIGMTPTFGSDLLEIVGPVTVQNQTFTAENLADKLEYQVEIGYKGQSIPEAQRKEILALLVDEVKSKLYALPLSEWKRVLEASERAVVTKQLIFYSRNPESQEVLDRMGFSGHVPVPEADGQLIVDANLASLKSDPFVSRSVRYEVEQVSGGQYVGRTTIRYEHTGTFDWKTTRYRTYVRLFVPSGSEFVKASGMLQDDALRDPAGTPGEVTVEQEGEWVSFGVFTSVEPGQTHEVTFEYLLAPQIVEAIRSGRYSLEFIKQIGSAAYPLTLDLEFDTTLKSASPAEQETEWGDDAYRLNTILDQDKKFEVTFK